MSDDEPTKTRKTRSDKKQFTEADMSAVVEAWKAELVRASDKSTLKTLETKLREQAEVLKKLEAPPHMFALVMQVFPETVVLSFKGQLAELPFDYKKLTLKRGDVVRLSEKTGTIVNVAEGIQMPGRIGRVESEFEGTAEVSIDGAKQYVACNVKASIGDKVVIESSGSAIVKNLGKPPSEQTFAADTGVTWEDIGGLVEAKIALREAIEQPVLCRDLYRAYGRRPPRGVLLYGPPGCGKTMLGKAAASALAKVHGASANAGGFIYIKGPELLNKYVGESEANMRQLFINSRQHKADHGYPAIIFIDEAEAILGHRDEGSFMSKTIVPMFLAEMDGLEDSGAMVLLATNRPSDLDPAVVRDGRVDHKIKITRPTQEVVQDIFALNLRGLPSTHDGCLASYATNEMFSLDRHLFDIMLKSGGHKQVRLEHLVNGAMVAGVVEKAKGVALRRDIAAGNKWPEGLTAADVHAAINATQDGLADLDHRGIVAELIPDGSEATGLRRA